MPRQELVIAAGYRLPRAPEMLSSETLPGGGLYFRSGPVRSEVHWPVVRDRASMATLVICGRLVSHRSSSGTASPGFPPLAAALAYSSAFLLRGIPWCAGT